jgi:hypothetical protein
MAKLMGAFLQVFITSAPEVNEFGDELASCFFQGNHSLKMTTFKAMSICNIFRIPQLFVISCLEIHEEKNFMGTDHLIFL